MRSGYVLDGPAKGEYRECSSEIMELDADYGKDIDLSCLDKDASTRMEVVTFILYRKIWDLSGEGKFYCWELT